MAPQFHLLQLLSLSTSALAAITADEASLISWRGYGSLISQYLTANQPVTKGTDFIYVTPPTSNFVRGGTPCPESVTNFELFNAVDPLQSVDSPLLGTDGPSYAQTLETYLMSVDLGTIIPTPAQEAKIKALEDTVTAAKQKFQKEKRDAFIAWQGDTVAQFFKQSFQSWVADNDPQYAAFQAQLTTADATYNNYMLSIYGAKYNTLQEQRTNINSKAQNELASLPGYNMMVYPQAPNYGVSITPFTKNEITDAISFKPTYNLASYEDICDSYFKGTAGVTSLTWNLKNVDGHDWSNLGYQQTIRSTGGGLWGILGYRRTTTSEVTHFNSWSDTFTSEVKLTLTMKGAPMVVPINAGFWNVGDVRKTYPKLRPNETDDLAGHVRLTQVMVGYGVGMQIQFTNTQTWRNVSQFIEEGKKSGGGGLSIFGFNFGAGSAGAYKRSTNDIKTSTTTDGGIISFPATPDGMIFMLGARGKAL